MSDAADGAAASLVSRRTALKAVAVAGFGASIPRWASGQTTNSAANWRASVPLYLDTLARADGGYAWEDQEHSHLTPTFAAIGCLQALKLEPARKAALAEFVRSHHPS